MHGDSFFYQAFVYLAAAVVAVPLAKRLGLPAEKYSVSFQSRLGKDPWLTPFTDVVLEELGAAGNI